MATLSAAELIAVAEQIFRPEGVASWFFAPHDRLDGARPVELLDGAPGRQKLDRLLNALASEVSS